LDLTGRRVLLTGHTGFKGGWLALWLARRGAKVVGLALPPEPGSFYERARVAEVVESHEQDLRDEAGVRAVVEAARPELVLHLAAQALVRRSYREPVETFATNVLGTVHLLEALRAVESLRAVVVVTTDKCYEDRPGAAPYQEGDPLGGHDPYAASKAAAELVAAAYRKSFFAPRVGVATARAGNVFGGGDAAEDRLVPDAMRAFGRGEALLLRNPTHVRPWQHVLDPLGGYLALAASLWADPVRHASAWNFGPTEDGVTTGALADALAALWGDGAKVEHGQVTGPHETTTLRLDATRARSELGWRPRLALDEGLAWTVEWHKAANRGEDLQALSSSQIGWYEARP
jgi:CDP-glucose 4,6-dehydratase